MLLIAIDFQHKRYAIFYALQKPFLREGCVCSTAYCCQKQRKKVKKAAAFYSGLFGEFLGSL